MKTLQKKLLLLSIATFITLSTTGCTSHQNVVRVSEAHGYNTHYGLVQDENADRQIQAELVAMSLPTEVEMPQNLKEGWTTTLSKDEDAFYAYEYVEKEEVITYKYKFDKKFYKNAEWRSAEF